MKQELNRTLLKIQEEWLELCKAESLSREHLLSRPFSFAVTESYIESSRRLMIVGQEARDFGAYSNDWPLAQIQQFNEDYVDTQLGKRETSYGFNHSPFWALFRAFDRCGIAPVWNNVDKFHRIEQGRTVPLTLEIERKLSIPYGADNRTLLQREIEAAAATGILFVTGPHYHETMALALGIADPQLTSRKPDAKGFCQDITDIASTGVPTFWTYHPAFLQRRGWLYPTVEIVAASVV